MRLRRSIFYSALVLTAVNLLLRFTGTAFHVYLSGRIGAAGIGLLQLILSVSSLSTTVAAAGIRTCTMYMTAEELGKKRSQNVTWVISGAIRYSIIFSLFVAVAVYFYAPTIAKLWIGELSAVFPIRLFSLFLPVTCLCGVMTGYFTAANRILTLAAVEIAEQILSITVTCAALQFWAGNDPAKACQAVILGGCFGALLTLCTLVILRLREKTLTGPRIPVSRRIADTALPLAVADDLRAGISATENLIVPKRLALFSGTTDPLALFGTVCGMVFPIMMFPSAILFGLTELLVPEMARCNAAGNRMRIRYLMERSLSLVILYGGLFAGLLFVLAKPLCLALYKSDTAGHYLQLYAPLVMMLYLDIVTDAMIKGLGQQRSSVRYNILTSALDVALLFVLLPKWGMVGYFISFTVTHAINFFLSIRRLAHITEQKPPIRRGVYCLVCACASVLAAMCFTSFAARITVFISVYLSALFLLGVVSRKDLQWLKGIIKAK